MASSPPKLNLQFHDTLGAALVGFSLSCVVFGVLSTQCFHYFRRYPLDRPLYKGLVALIWFLETFDQFLIGHAVYFYCITNFGRPLSILLGDIAWSLISQLLVGATVGTLVKLCFAMRVWRFSNRNIPITGVLLMLIFGQYALAIYYAVKAFELNKFQYADRLKLVATLALGAGTLTDIITAGALCWFLRKLRTGYKQSDSLVTSLSIYALNTGAVTSAISVATLVMYNVSPHNFIFIGLYFVLSKLYANSLLCTLNTRRIVRGRGTDRAAGETGTSRSGTTNVNVYNGHSFHLYGSGGQRYPRTPVTPQSKSGLEIGVHQEVSVHSDIDVEGDYLDPPAPARSPTMPQSIQYTYDPYHRGDRF